MKETYLSIARTTAVDFNFSKCQRYNGTFPSNANHRTKDVHIFDHNGFVLNAGSVMMIAIRHATIIVIYFKNKIIEAMFTTVSTIELIVYIFCKSTCHQGLSILGSVWVNVPPFPQYPLVFPSTALFATPPLTVED